MVKVSKRYKTAAEKYDADNKFELEEAVNILQSFDKAKFDETIELSVNLGVDPKQGNQMVRGTLSLPHGSGKSVKVVVFTDNAQEAIDAGADEAGLDELLKKIQDGWMDFDVAISTTSAMKQVRTLARILGPRGLMPNPKSGTVTDDVVEGIKAVKAGRVEYKMDKTANMAVILGKRSFSNDQILENTKAVVDAIAKARPEGFQGRFVKSMTISSSMSPGVKLAPSIYNKF